MRSEGVTAGPRHGPDGSGAGGVAAAGRRLDSDYLRRSLLLDVVEASGRRILRSSADGRGRDPPRHVDRRRYRIRRATGLDPLGVADELGGVSRHGNPVRQPARGGKRDDPAQRHADGGGRHADRDTRRAAIGRLELAVVCTRQGVGDGAGCVVACGWRCRRRGGFIEIHRAVLRPGDPALADRDPEAAALADLAMALPRRAGRDCDVRRRSFSGMPNIIGYPSSSRWGGRGSRISGRPSSPN